MNRDQIKLLLGAIPIILLIGLVLMGCVPETDAEAKEPPRFTTKIYRTPAGFPDVRLIRDTWTGACFFVGGGDNTTYLETAPEVCQW